MADEQQIRDIAQAVVAQAGKASIDDANIIYLLFSGVLVFFMHAGFAMLEAGSVKESSVTNIMFKNIGTISIGSVFYWFFGWAWAYGSSSADEPGLDGENAPGFNGFIGYVDFASTGKGFDDGGNGAPRALWFFQMVFAATAATIVSGAVAGRIRLEAYFFLAVVITGFIYPVVSHWIWATGGWLSAFTASEDLTNFGDDSYIPCGMVDYAGSGVVHMTGGVAAFWCALILKPRLGWTKEEGIPAHNQALVALGTFILWFGWFGFNVGSTLAWDDANAGHVAVTTTIAPSAAVLTGVALDKLLNKRWSLTNALNCLLGGLVSITAGCSTLTVYLALVAGIVGALVYTGASKLMKKIGVDDPVDAIAVHGFCGAWGVLIVGLGMDKDLFVGAYSGKECDVEVGQNLTWQLIGILSIIGWVSATVLVLLLPLYKMNKLRLTDEEQEHVDKTEHGMAAYNLM